MPNDTLDEIEARWKSVFGCGEVLSDIRTLIEMVRARDRVVDAADKLADHAYRLAKLHRIGELEGAAYEYGATRDTLDAPPAQEQEQ